MFQSNNKPSALGTILAPEIDIQGNINVSGNIIVYGQVTGDIISTGTPYGVSLKNPNTPFLKDGDAIHMEIEGLGTIQNTVRFVD